MTLVNTVLKRFITLLGQKKISHPKWLTVAKEVIEGFIHLYDIGILHNDIKGNNIILHWPKFNVKIIDFGRATLKSFPSVYNLSSKDKAKYNIQHCYLAFGN